MRGTRARLARAAAWLATSLAGAALVGGALAADAHWAERHVLPGYCATGQGEWILARGLPWAAAALGVLATWRLARAARAGRLSLRGRAGPLAATGLAVAAALGAGEVVARRLHDRLMLGPAAPGGSGAAMTRADPRLGWVYVPGRTTWTEVGGRAIAYAIDADGDRAASEARADPARPSIVFAGESIAFGYGLPWDETFAAVVARDLGLQAVNAAVVGYGSDQAHLRALDALARLERPLAVVTLFLPDQIERNADPWRPRLGLGPDGGLVALPPSGGPRLLRLVAELPLHGDAALRTTAAILRATAEAARARGALPVFVVTNYGAPCLHRDGEEPWVVETLFARQGLPFVRVDLDPGDLLPGTFERHPSARGAAKIARAVEAVLAAELPLRRAAHGRAIPGSGRDVPR